MPFKSQAQRRKFAQLLVEGKISNQTFEEWNRETGGKKLPERVGSERRVRKAGTRTRKNRDWQAQNENLFTLKPRSPPLQTDRTAAPALRAPA